MLSAKFRAQGEKIIKPIAGIFAKSGLHPNVFTFIALVLALITAWAIVLQFWLIGGILILITGAIDSLDGAIARIMKKTSKVGAYFDALTDRYVEGIILFGIGVATGYWAVVFLLFLGAVLTSYAKARASMEAKIDNIAWPEIIERAERVVILGLALIVFAFFNEPILGANILYWLLGLLALLCNISAVQRILRASRLIAKEEEIQNKK